MITETLIPDFIGITETKLDRSLETATLELEDYVWRKGEEGINSKTSGNKARPHSGLD